MAQYLCWFCNKFENALIGFYQKRHDECRKKADVIKEKDRFWGEYPS